MFPTCKLAPVASSWWSLHGVGRGIIHGGVCGGVCDGVRHTLAAANVGGSCSGAGSVPGSKYSRQSYSWPKGPRLGACFAEHVTASCGRGVRDSSHSDNRHFTSVE